MSTICDVSQKNNRVLSHSKLFWFVNCISGTGSGYVMGVEKYRNQLDWKTKETGSCSNKLTTAIQSNLSKAATLIA